MLWGHSSNPKQAACGATPGHGAGPTSFARWPRSGPLKYTCGPMQGHAPARSRFWSRTQASKAQKSIEHLNSFTK